MTELEKIYYKYQNDLSLCDSDAAIAARDSLYDFLAEKGLNLFDCEDFIGDLASENEKQGFLSGFKYAMKIAMECMDKQIA